MKLYCIVLFTIVMSVLMIYRSSIAHNNDSNMYSDKNSQLDAFCDRIHWFKFEFMPDMISF